MAILPSLRNLLIPNKTKRDPAYQTDMQELEIWARQPIQQLIAGSGVTLSPASGEATDAKGNGPFPITISASGGGGGITRVSSPLGSITITNPTGPTVDVDVVTYPLLQFGDGANENTAYGPGSMAGGVSAGTNNTAIGANAGAALSNAGGGSPLNNTLIGFSAGSTMIKGLRNTCVGSEAGENIATTGSTDNAMVGFAAGFSITSGIGNTCIGSDAQSAASNKSNVTAIGFGVKCNGNGSVAIGVNATGASVATASNDNDFVLGTSDHVVCFLNNLGGSSTITLGSANAPGSGGAPTTFIKVRLNGGTIGYIPVWT